MSGTLVLSPHISFSEELPGRFNDGSGLWEPCHEHMFLGRSCHSFYNLSVDVLELHFHVFFWLRQVIKASADSKERELDSSFWLEEHYAGVSREGTDGTICDFFPLPALLPQFTFFPMCKITFVLSQDPQSLPIFQQWIQFQCLVI